MNVGSKNVFDHDSLFEQIGLGSDRPPSHPITPSESRNPSQMLQGHKPPPTYPSTIESYDQKMPPPGTNQRTN